MRKISLWVALLGFMVSAAPVFGAGPAPMAVVDNPGYDFAQVVYGTVVTHDFVIKNQGDAPLTIGKISSN